MVYGAHKVTTLIVYMVHSLYTFLTFE